MYAATFAASAPDRAAIVMGSGEVVTCRGARRALQQGSRLRQTREAPTDDRLDHDRRAGSSGDV
jgi:hypothetical protein